MRFVTIALLLLLAAVQAELWLGDGGIPAVMRQQARLDAKQRANAELSRANQRLAAEVEDRARSDLGMVKPDEILVQYAPRR